MTDQDFLFGEGGDEATEKLTISQTYAKKYNERKDKEELTRASRVLADEDALDDESSEEETEDEDGEMLTDSVDNKIFETLTKIKRKDPSIYDHKK
eukprot:698013-Amphidinium_carterae.1